MLDLRLRAEESTDAVEIAIMIFPKVGDRERDRFVGRDTAAFQTHAFGGRDVPDRNVDREPFVRLKNSPPSTPPWDRRPTMVPRPVSWMTFAKTSAELPDR